MRKTDILENVLLLLSVSEFEYNNFKILLHIEILCNGLLVSHNGNGA